MSRSLRRSTPRCATSSAATPCRPWRRRSSRRRTRVPDDNPLAEGLRLRRRPDPCILVIFGASGDLTSKKLMPALYALAVRGLLPERFGIVGAARTEESDDGFRDRMQQAVQDHARDPFRQDVW